MIVAPSGTIIFPILIKINSVWTLLHPSTHMCTMKYFHLSRLLMAQFWYEVKIDINIELRPRKLEKWYLYCNFHHFHLRAPSTPISAIILNFKYKKYGKLIWWPSESYSIYLIFIILTDESLQAQVKVSYTTCERQRNTIFFTSVVFKGQREERRIIFADDRCKRRKKGLG